MSEKSFIVQNSIKEFIHDELELKITGEGFDNLATYSKKLIKLMLVLSKKNVLEDNRKTIQPKDIIYAYDTLINGEETYDKAVFFLKECIQNIEDEKNKRLNQVKGDLNEEF